jgi:hypothetical protein
MNVNVKLSLTDEERNTMFRRLTGKTTKGMVSRADVNQWVKDQLQTFLTLGSPTTETINDRGSDQYANPEPIDIDDMDVEEVIRQNKLLQTRVNRLQYLIDTRGLK